MQDKINKAILGEYESHKVDTESVCSLSDVTTDRDSSTELI